MSPDEQIVRALDGDQGCQDQLLARLDDEPQLRKALLDQILIGSLLHCAAIRSEGTTAERVRYLLRHQRQPEPACPSSQPPGPSRAPRLSGRWPWRLTAGLLLPLLALTLWPWFEASEPIRVLHSDAHVLSHRLAAGDQLRLEPHSRLQILDPDTIRLQAGAVHCQVDKEKRGLQPFQVLLDGHLIQVLGTSFRVGMAADGTHLRVQEGRVRILPEGHIIAAGGGALLRSTGPQLFPADAIETFDPMRLDWRLDSNRVVNEALRLVPGEDAHGGYLRCDRRSVIPGELGPWLSCVARLPEPGLTVPADATGIGLWLLGRGDGHAYHLAVRDYSARGQEHFIAQFSDSQAGWHRIELPWSAFERWCDFQHEDAVDDGFDRQHFTAILVGIRIPPSDHGPQSFAFDQLVFLTPSSHEE
ncbi:MAG: FecR domain-containing protein [Planctomycetota bacterium]